MLKVLILNNCHNCPNVGWNGEKDKVCCITGSSIEGFDSDFLPESIFPPDCPLKTFDYPDSIKHDDYV